MGSPANGLPNSSGARYGVCGSQMFTWSIQLSRSALRSIQSSATGTTCSALSPPLRPVLYISRQPSQNHQAE